MKKYPKKEVFGNNIWIWDTPESGHWKLTKKELAAIKARKEKESMKMSRYKKKSE